MVTSKISEGRKRKILITAQPKRWILIIGGIHVSGYAESDNLGHYLNVTGYVKHADWDIIMTTAKSESKKYDWKWCDNIMWWCEGYWEKWDTQRASLYLTIY